MNNSKQKKAKRELKECPFCGGEAVIFQHYNEYGIWAISCDSCHVEMNSLARDFLVAAWNTRPAAEAQPGEKKEITEIIRDISAENSRVSRLLHQQKEKNSRLIAEIGQLKDELEKCKRVLSGICFEKSARICDYAPESCKVCSIRKVLKNE